MTRQSEPMPQFLEETPRLGDEISVTGKWVPKSHGLHFMKSADAKQTSVEWEAILQAGSENGGVLLAEMNRSVGGDAVLAHLVFRDASAVERFFSSTARPGLESLSRVASPDLHLVRGVAVSDALKASIASLQIPVAIGSHIYGFVKDDYRRPDPETSINVTAKWTCKPGGASKLDELKYWWQRVGTDAHSMEEGLVRFEAYEVVGEDALIIHETFTDTEQLKFHLTKGTAHKYKSDIDEIAVPERYYFRGPVSWLIRTYSKFMRLPATYSRVGSSYLVPGGTMSDGTQ